MSELLDEISKRYSVEMKSKAKSLTDNKTVIEDNFLRQLMVIRNQASIEIRTAFRFVYDYKSQEKVYKRIEELSDKLDKYISQGLE